MTSTRVTAALALVLLFASALRCQTSSNYFPVDEIKPGLVGTGRTIFEGDKVEEFRVEFLGVLRNALAPKRDVILARLSGGPLDKTGVIAGMSGSPVYVDGKLVGAVALSFPFSKDPIAGITPIAEMTDVVPRPGAKQSRGARSRSNLDIRIAPGPDQAGGGRLLFDGAAYFNQLAKSLPAEGAAGSMAGISLPLRAGGISPQAMESYAPLLRRLGFEPMAGVVLSGSPSPEVTDGPPAPGTMISMLLMHGDLNLNADCTVTLVRDNSLYACGHRFLVAGPTDIPFARAHVITSVASLSSSFKLDVPGPLAGVIHQDRFSAIYGVLGDKAAEIPVKMRVESTLNRPADYSFQMVQDSLLSPLLLNLAVSSALQNTERAVGPSSLAITGSINLTNGESVRLDDVLSSDMNTPGLAGVTVAAPLGVLLSSDFPDLQVKDINLSVVSSNEKKELSIEQVWTSKAEVQPGDHIEVMAILRDSSGATQVRKIPVHIPESVSDRRLSMMVGGGAAINALQFHLSPLASTPRDLHQLVHALNRLRKNDRLYVLLMAPQRSFVLRGDEYPSPPPSLVQTFMSDPSVASSVIFSGTSVLGDYEGKETDFAIHGQKNLYLKVAQPGQ
jgi:SpoIVB peptidase S55